MSEPVPPASGAPPAQPAPQPKLSPTQPAPSSPAANSGQSTPSPAVSKEQTPPSLPAVNSGQALLPSPSLSAEQTAPVSHAFRTGSATIIQLPPAATALPVGERLEAVVLSRLANTQTVLQTRLGQLIVQTNLVLPLEARVTLQVTAGGTQPSVQIFIRPAPSAAPPATSQSAGATPPTGLGAKAAPQLSGPPTAATPSNFAAPADTQSQIRGSVVNATVIRVSGPGLANAPYSGGRTSSPVGNTAGPATLSPGDRLAVKIAAVTRPGTAAPPASPRTSSMTGTVTGTNTVGHAIVRTNTAELSLAVPRPLPTGSNLLLQTSGNPILPFRTDVQQNTLVLAERWETLNDAIRTGPSAAAPNSISQTIPQPGAQFTNSLLFFIAALRAGDLRSWLGQDAMRHIDRESLLGRITEEFGLMQRIANEPAGQDWRLFLIPIFSDEQLHQMRLFVRDGSGGERDDSDPQETRFVIEVTFTNLGQFQFDGLARPKALDLIIRTEHKISSYLQHAITDVFTDTTSALGLSGGISFKMERFYEFQPLRDSGLAIDSGVIA